MSSSLDRIRLLTDRAIAAKTQSELDRSGSRLFAIRGSRLSADDPAPVNRAHSHNQPSVYVVRIVPAMLSLLITISQGVLASPRDGSASPNHVHVSQQNHKPTTASAVRHYLYVLPDSGTIYVYDMDHDHSLVKTIQLPVTFIRGFGADAAGHAVYVAYGGVS